MTYEQLLEAQNKLIANDLEHCPAWVVHLYQLGWVSVEFIITKMEN